MCSILSFGPSCPNQSRSMCPSRPPLWIHSSPLFDLRCAPGGWLHGLQHSALLTLWFPVGFKQDGRGRYGVFSPAVPFPHHGSGSGCICPNSNSCQLQLLLGSGNTILNFPHLFWPRRSNGFLLWLVSGNTPSPDGLLKILPVPLSRSSFFTEIFFI